MTTRDKEKTYRPTDREPFMNERQREYFRTKLLAWKDEILKEAQETLQHLQDENQNHPDLADRVAGTGELPPVEVAAHLRACDLLLQPYPDGVSSRRTSVMAGLANRVPVVTNLGTLSESLWAASSGVAVVRGPDPAALAAAVVEVFALSPENRLALGARGAALYFSEFTLERTIERLRDHGPTPVGTNRR